jgi:hypothetical protein
MVENPAQMSNGLYDLVDSLAEMGITVEFVSDEGAAEGSGPGDAEMVPLEDVLNVIMRQSAGEDMMQKEPLLALKSGESDMPILPSNFSSSPSMSTSGDSTQRLGTASSSDGNTTGSGSTSSGGSRAKRTAPRKSDGSTTSGSSKSGKAKAKKVDPKKSEKKTRKTKDTKKKPGKLNKKPARAPKKKKDGDAK